jgi:hypothetical protein
MIRQSVLALVLAAAPLCAQMKHDDHDVKVAGAGALPAGWSGRADGSAKVEATKFVATGSSYHVTTGPAAIYWKGTENVTGPFTMTAKIQQLVAPTHPEAYGLVFAGNNLQADNQTYFYFLVRGDGKYMVKHRAGSEVHTVVDWTDSPAVAKQDAKGVAINTLTVDASRADSTRLSVNGKQVAALALGKTTGIAGIRVNHNLDVVISDFSVTQKK